MSVFQFWKHDVTSLCASLHELLNDVAMPDESDASDSEDEPQTDVNGRVERLVAKLRHVFYGMLDRPVKEEDCKQVAEMLARSHVMARLVTPSLLSQLSFETRKSVAALFRALVHRDQSSTIVCDVALMTRLAQGYTASTDTALVCGSMLRDCLERIECAHAFLLNMPAELELLVATAATHPHFEVSSDALSNIGLLLTHKNSVPVLLAEFDRVFTAQYQTLLLSDNYATQRHALQILSKVLLDPMNGAVMMKYISKRDHLKTILRVLRRPSDALRMDAFHIFKIFVANPNKTHEVEAVLLRNRDKLHAYVKSFGATHHGGKQQPGFLAEIRLLLFTLEHLDQTKRELEPPTDDSRPPKKQQTATLVQTL
ncbi:hypothetical protein SDRG_07359 [Saprolegnia diclina VS20]|uniref:Calcium binding protein 39 n=1 Tax=Saprolegnia diclina (strain VS20) TaxID=1156394 RepID=T0QK83_SAPDV|nr:hypothetical protein SDRG_07359 [Saprolegnia diclina VS20]EQC35126.1 hypothetical protein SDRG_07359 [Saprolegnia diclina VS20]|eukprot:XP_008611410.1 hypothetical protein SDRG_07359 [Saprolegnia diclina VS20]